MPETVSPDEQLLRRIRAGDPAAEERLFRTYIADVTREAARALSSADAEEAAANVLNRAIANAQAGKLRAPIRPWLMTVTRNEVIDFLRRAVREREGQAALAEELQLARDAAGEEEDVVVEYPRVAVLQALRRIKEREEKTVRQDQRWSYAQILEWDGRGIETADMAKWMGTSANTARQRKMRAHALLKEEVEGLLARGEVLREKE